MFLHSPSPGQRQRDGPRCARPKSRESLRDSTRSFGTHHPHQGVTPGLTRDTRIRICLCQCSSRSAEIPLWHDMEQDPGARAKESGAEQAGQRVGGKLCPQTCRAAPQQEQGRARPSPGSPQPSCASLPQKRVQISQGYGMASLKLVHSCLLTHQQ